MNKKIKGVIIAICAIVTISFIFLIVWNHKISSWNEDEIKEFFLQNKEEFTALAQKIYDKSNDEFVWYHNRGQLLLNGINSELFWRFKVESIACWKNSKFDECDEVEITFAGTLDQENRRNHYYEWGIYYSPNNEMIGYVGHHIKWEDGEQESYEYKPELERAHYYTERICHNWFFYKQGVWN
ncbi:MAG: hypothetical protein IJ716_13205 [Lachnospiraceae bacterium]|nr:hypothetical protein [Lachnospiraceae bacterium]